MRSNSPRKAFAGGQLHSGPRLSSCILSAVLWLQHSFSPCRDNTGLPRSHPGETIGMDFASRGSDELAENLGLAPPSAAACRRTMAAPGLAILSVMRPYDGFACSA